MTAGQGVVGDDDVDDVQVDCAAGGAQLQIQITDDGDYASYGSVRDYRVLLANSGNGPVQDIQVAASFDPAFDVAEVTWDCLSSAPDTSCTPSGSGGFSASASLAPGTSVTWLLRVPVRADSTAAQAILTIHADGADSASDTNTLVIFRDGMDVPYGARAKTMAAGKHATAAADGPAAGSRPGPAQVSVHGIAAGVDGAASASASATASVSVSASGVDQPPGTASDDAPRGTAATPVPATGTWALVLMLLAMAALARRRLGSATERTPGT